MSVSQEVADFMNSVAPTQAPPAEAEQSAPPTFEQPPVQEQPTAQPEPLPVATDAQQEAGETAPPPAAGAKTPEQLEIERLRAELSRVSVDQEVASFENNLKRTTDTYVSTKQQSIDAAHKRHRDLIDEGSVEQADKELRDFYAKMEVADNNMRQYIQNQRMEYAKRREHVELGPKYAQHLGQVHGLSAEDVALLSKFDGFTQDKMISDLAARNRAVKSNEARLRDLEASVRAQSGAFSPGGTTGSATPPQSQRPSDPMQAEVWDYMQSPIIPSGGQR